MSLSFWSQSVLSLCQKKGYHLNWCFTGLMFNWINHLIDCVTSPIGSSPQWARLTPVSVWSRRRRICVQLSMAFYRRSRSSTARTSLTSRRDWRPSTPLSGRRSIKPTRRRLTSAKLRWSSRCGRQWALFLLFSSVLTHFCRISFISEVLNCHINA